MRKLMPLLLALALSPLAFAAEPAPAVPPQSLKKQLTATPLAEIVIPSFSADQTTLGDAIAVLTQQVKKNSKNGLELQWVYKDVDAAKWPHTVTLTAKDKSAGKILSEIAAQAKVEVKLEEHAIVIKPIAAPAAPKAQSAAPTPPQTAAALEKKSPLDMPSLDKGSVESSRIDDEYDQTPIKGRNPIKK
ncbi:hypothetical protein [Haloferula sp. BvORR071]|uniref:hypothetical protein n=1 Tax=Haloferula sp. BvORR071 TaxID=1396141 RepID=UPI002240F05E|nr:hypothetical protein [Haloferula sp. BvORR071]